MGSCQSWRVGAITLIRSARYCDGCWAFEPLGQGRGRAHQPSPESSAQRPSSPWGTWHSGHGFVGEITPNPRAVLKKLRKMQRRIQHDPLHAAKRVRSSAALLCAKLSSARYCGYAAFKRWVI